MVYMVMGKESYCLFPFQILGRPLS